VDVGELRPAPTRPLRQLPVLRAGCWRAGSEGAFPSGHRTPGDRHPERDPALPPRRPARLVVVGPSAAGVGRAATCWSPATSTARAGSGGTAGRSARAAPSGNPAAPPPPSTATPPSCRRPRPARTQCVTARPRRGDATGDVHIRQKNKQKKKGKGKCTSLRHANFVATPEERWPLHRHGRRRPPTGKGRCSSTALGSRLGQP